MSTAFTEGPRFTTSTPWNHQPGLWIVTILSAIYSFLGLITRYGIIRKKFTRADAVLAASYVLASCSYALIFAALVSDGVGKSPETVSRSSFVEASKLVFAAILVLLLAVGCAGCSQIFQLEEIMVQRKDKRLCWISILVCSCLSVAGIVVVSAGCSPDRTQEFEPAMCSHPVTRWSVTVALIVTNILVPTLLPCYLLRWLQCKLSQKIGVYLIFAFLLGNIPVAIVALFLYIRFTRNGPTGTGIVDFLCCLQVLLGWALICPTILIGRPVSLKFNTHGSLILSASDRSFSIPVGPSTISEPPTRTRRSIPFDLDSTGLWRGENDSQKEEQHVDDSIIRRTVTTEIQSMNRD